MFSRLNVRTKLLVMLLPAAVGLCSFAGLGVQSRLAEQQAARRVQDAFSLAEAGSAFVHELQSERLFAATVATDRAAAGPLFDAQREATDGAATTLRSLLRDGAGRDGTAADAASALGHAVGALADVRGQDGATTPDVIAAYSSLVDEAMAAVGRFEATDGAGGVGVIGRRWLAEAIEAESSAAATAAELFADGRPSDRVAVVHDTQQLLERSGTFLDTFVDYAGVAGVESLREARAESGSDAADAAFEQLSGPEAPTALDEIDAAMWPGLVESRLTPMVAIETAGIRSDVARLTDAADDSDASVVYFAAGAAGTCLLVLLLAFGVSRQITTGLGRLARSAQEISTDQVPALVQSLKSGTTSGVSFSRVEVEDGDELAAVAHALNDLGEAMVSVATEQQQSLRKGIGDIFVNLARRNQTLLDRQIQFIDRLEANEQDPDQLENLFRLDHLATRMRRNAESLLVLAGAEAPRRRSREVEISDVIRVAVGEVEDFHRISLVAVEDVETVGGAAVDIAHLLAELMENGAQYSPPERSVEVVGRRTVDGGYLISVTDHGVGMTAERIEQVNRLLASPPPVGLALTRSLGFVVAGTLAERHGIGVRIAASDSGGVTAEVSIPVHLIARAVPDAVAMPGTVATPDEVVVSDGPTALSLMPEVPGAPSTVGGGWTADGEFVPVGRTPHGGQPLPTRAAPPEVEMPMWAPDRLPSAPSPAKLVDMLPEGPAFDQGLYSLLDRPVPPVVPESSAPEGAATPPFPVADVEVSQPSLPAAHEPLPPIWEDSPPLWEATPPVWEGGPPEYTEGTRSAAAPAGPALPASPALPQRAPGATASAAPTDEVQRTAAPTRDADGVRSVLSRYRDGLGSGRQETGPDTTPDDGIADRPDPGGETPR